MGLKPWVFSFLCKCLHRKQEIQTSNPGQDENISLEIIIPFIKKITDFENNGTNMLQTRYMIENTVSKMYRL